MSGNEKRARHDLGRRLAVRTLGLLVAAERVVAAAEEIALRAVTPASRRVNAEIGFATLALLLALKAGPATPEELAARMGCAAPVAPQRILRARRHTIAQFFVGGRQVDGRYDLTPKGHRFVNAVAAFDYHHVSSA